MNDTHNLTSNSAFIFIEFQNEWLNESGNLRTKLIEDQDTFDLAVSNAQSLLTLLRIKSANIIHATMQPDMNYTMFGKAQFGLRALIPTFATWRGHMQEIHPNFTPKDNEIVITERTGASAFSGSMLDSILRNNRINTLFLSGFASHICVESTLREAHDKGYDCYIITDTTAAFNSTQQMYFENEIIPHFGKAITLSEIQQNIK